VNRGVHVGGASQGRPSYMNLAFFKAKPAADAMGRFQEYVQPILEKLSAEGEIGRFGVEVPELHGDPSWSHVFWYQTPGLGGRDAFHAALQAADEARGEAEAAAMRERWGETFESEAHWDEILAIVHWAGAEGGEGGEGGR
ncbi:MAG: hypothetical protein OEP45_15905, partial [Acidobacteriota bacterium]|nr:hypothetical protein [Acidobacteriota bacterium]